MSSSKIVKNPKKITTSREQVKIPGLYMISLVVLTHLEKWWPWLMYQSVKQLNYIVKKGLDFQFVIVVPERLIEKAYQFFGSYKEVPITLVKVGDTDSIGTIRNKAIEYCHGFITAFSDQDDWFPDYRLHYQWTKLIMTKYNLSTVDNFLSYSISENKLYNNHTSSESCLMFKTNFAKNKKFAENQKAGEGNKFSEGENVLIEEDVVLIVATEHSQNTTSRSGTESTKWKVSEIYNEIELKMLEDIERVSE
jgi:hypothetical protein